MATYWSKQDRRENTIRFVPYWNLATPTPSVIAQAERHLSELCQLRHNPPDLLNIFGK